MIGVTCKGSLCSARPVGKKQQKQLESNAGPITYGPFSISQSSGDASYQFCHCNHLCNQEANWLVVPGFLNLKANKDYLFTSYKGAAVQDGHSVLSFSRDDGVMTVYVQRPPFKRQGNDVNDWQLKLVSQEHSCADNFQEKFFHCTGQNDKFQKGPAEQPFCNPSSIANPDAASFTIEIDHTNKRAAGTYQVCFRKSTGSAWAAILNKEAGKSNVLTLAALADDKDLPPGFHLHDSFSAAAGSEAVITLRGTKLGGGGS